MVKMNEIIRLSSKFFISFHVPLFYIISSDYFIEGKLIGYRKWAGCLVRTHGNKERNEKNKETMLKNAHDWNSCWAETCVSKISSTGKRVTMLACTSLPEQLVVLANEKEPTFAFREHVLLFFPQYWRDAQLLWNATCEIRLTSNVGFSNISGDIFKNSVWSKVKMALEVIG